MQGIFRSRMCLLALLIGPLLSACDSSGDQPVTDAAVVVDEHAAALVLPQEPPSARLPAGVTPRHYRLSLVIDPRENNFTGTAEIEIELDAATDFIWLHGNGLEVSSATAQFENGETLELQWQQLTPSGVAKLSASQTMPAGKARLTLVYTAPFNESLEGLYKVEAGDESYAYTQFEATSARLAFPSFDEPAYKVPFDVSLTIPEQFVAVTNTPVLAESSNGDGSKTVVFATTKPLPTYLVAFAVGAFDVVEWEPIPASKLREQPLPLRGITTKGKGERIHFALANTAAIVLEQEAYFGTPYPYAKLDLIAVPDFNSGAMENAGAITYREPLILLDENSSVDAKRSFFYVHAHELAHQWFGNLVTPQWWDDIWLNEAFATWNAYNILDRLYPDQNYREALQNTASYVMRSDSLASARQIREPITRHEDIGSAFNGITYEKGAGVLSMFEAFLGRDQFRDGIRHYMDRYAFGNTTADQFIGAIADANPQVDGDDLREAFRSYIEQPGLPVVAAKMSCTPDGVSLMLSQQRYLPVGSQGASQTTWTVPVCVSTLQSSEPGSQCFLLRDATETVMLNTETCPDALLPNTDGAGYYRWALEPKQWQELLQAFDQLNVTEQISVANSLSAALNAGSVSLEEYFAAMPTITASPSWRVAMAPGADLDKIREFVAQEEDLPALQGQLRQWYQPQLDALNAQPELRAEQEQFRAQLMSTLGLDARDPAIRKELLEVGTRYTGFGGDRQLHADTVDANIRLLAMMVAVEELGKPYADLLWEQFLASDNATQRQELLIAMAWSTDPEVASQMRARILSPEVRGNEFPGIYYAQTSHPQTRVALWEWTVENMDAVLARLPAWVRGQLPSDFAGFCSEEDAARVEAAFAPIIDSLEAGPRYLANTLETIRLCSALVDFHKAAPEPDL